MPERTLTVAGKEYRLKDHIPLSVYREWAESNPMSLETGLPGLNAVLAEPLGEEDLDAEEYFALHRAVFDFFAGLRWGRSEPSAS